MGLNSASITALTFLMPFSSGMWFSIFIAFILTSLVLFFVSRVSPYERRSVHNNGCFGDGFSFCNSFWFVLSGFFMRAESNLSPKVRKITTSFISRKKLKCEKILETNITVSYTHLTLPTNREV